MQVDLDAKLHALAQDLSELKCHSHGKEAICNAIASEINEYLPNLDAEFNSPKLEELKTNGIVRLDVKLTEAQLLDTARRGQRKSRQSLYAQTEKTRLS